MTTALYRRYRPETFADVIGQEHVTEPLMQALRSGRITHAYLFSGPRGCGKTTSARILARCLNCAEGPTDVPCGTCPSCVELSRGGSGSLDVVEIDAASHNGVDDARDLRERAAFAPARDRFKIFILDEAHMVTPQGFNALLKIVEEPPAHVKFIFATTEPDKVIGTIRSRTHHYPFRLVPPAKLESYLSLICREENATVSDGVLPLVVRAGGGSVRDSLSVLDQLMAGADDSGLDYERAIALLGYTHGVLLDEMVEAIADHEAARVFGVVDQVIESGHDPRRFVEDLLERFRDLIVISAVGAGASAVLRAIPDDQLERMREQTERFGAAELSRAADTVNQALTDMVGATSPRLHLELLCARVLLPAIDGSSGGLGARVDRMERALAGGTMPAPTSHRSPAAPPVPPPARVESTLHTEPTARVEPAPQVDVAAPEPEPGAEADVLETDMTQTPNPASVPSDSGLDTVALKQRWPEVLAALAKIRRVSWALVSEYAQVVELNADALVLSFSTPALANTFANGPHADMVRQAVTQALGFDVRVEVAGEGPAQSFVAQPSGDSRSADRAPREPERNDSFEPKTGAAADRETDPPQEVEWGDVVAPGSAPRTHPARPAVTEPETRQGMESESSWPEPVQPGQARGRGGPAEPPADRSSDGNSSGRNRDETPPGVTRGSMDEPPIPQPHADVPAGDQSGPSPHGAHRAKAGVQVDRDTQEASAPAKSGRVADSSSDSTASPGAEEGSADSVPQGSRPQGDSARNHAEAAVRVRPEDDVASIDDPDAENSGLMGAPLIERMLGGVVIDEITLDD